jgi:hypothetical protein
MNSILAKLTALRERVDGVQNIHSEPPANIFVSMRDQFISESEKVKETFPDLKDFIPQQYEQFRADPHSYYRWATRALITDIDYFINYLKHVTSVQVPEMKVSDEGMYFAGQQFDALLKFNEFIAKATKEIILIDGFLNEKILELLASKNPSVICRVLTYQKSITPSLNTFIEAFKKQFSNLEVRTSAKFHDRFVIIDQSDYYHFGASIKDAGNKGFMFSKIGQDFIKDSLIAEFELEWKK